jgi:pimeloyl-ACP methyl ester carboxylesterase
MPDRSGFGYTFEMSGDTICSFVEQFGVDRYAVYIQDYGAPTDFGMAMRHPHRMTANMRRTATRASGHEIQGRAETR